MRRFLLLASLVLVGLLSLGVLALGATDRPLPWRGALTRRTWRELARGDLPGLACRSASRSDRAPALTDRLPVTGRFNCTVVDSARGYRATLLVDEGWVLEERRTWLRPPAAGRAFVDSVASVTDSLEEARCDDREERPSPEYLRRVVRWLAEDGVSTELFADSARARLGGGEGWTISVTRHQRWHACPGE